MHKNTKLARLVCHFWFCSQQLVTFVLKSMMCQARKRPRYQNASCFNYRYTSEHQVVIERKVSRHVPVFFTRHVQAVQYDYKDIKELEIFLCQPATTNEEQVIFFLSRLKKNSRSTRTILQSARSATRKTRHFLNFFGNENFDVYLYEFCIY